MQEIKKRRILLASVLKPADEPRMFDRFGQSLAAQGYEVFIAGLTPTTVGQPPGIHFLPHDRFNRISIGRIRARLKILRKAFTIKPDVLVITTHELIGVALIYRILTGRKIIYDVQENYWSNIMYINAWPTLMRPFVAFFVRLKEVITSPLFSRFFLAEKCYETELGFVKGKLVVIENKCKLPLDFQRKRADDLIQVIFTGTIAASTGVFQAIDLIKKLHEVNSRIRLTIIGHCVQVKVLQKLEHEIAGLPFISLIGGKDFVPHGQIMEAIATSHFGIIYYPPSPHTENKVPSKLYEYLACGLPILLQNHKRWVELCSLSRAAIIIDYEKPDISMILQAIDSNEFYLTSCKEANWENEEEKLLKEVNQLL